MKITSAASAGSDRPGDILIEIRPNEGGNVFTLKGKSAVMKLFRKQEEALIGDILREDNAENADVRAADNGALDCAIRARLTCALYRGAQRTGPEDAPIERPVDAKPISRDTGIWIDANDPKQLMDAPLYGVSPIVFDLTASEEPDAARLLLSEALKFYRYTGEIYAVIHDGIEGLRDVAALRRFDIPFRRRG